MEAKPKSSVEYSVKFTWRIENFSTIETERIYSDVFSGEDLKWRILIILPKGNGVGNHLSIYLEVADSAALPSGWTRHVKLRFSVVSEVDKNTFIKEAPETTFSEGRIALGLGYQSFLSLDKLRKPDQRFLVGDTCTVRAEVWFNEENQKEEPNMKSKVDKLEQSSSSLATLKTLFADIQNQIEDTTDSSFSDEEIAEAKANYKKCFNMDVTSFIRSGKAPELKNALSLLLTAKAFPETMVDGATKFMNDLDEHCKKYEAAQRDLSEAQEDEDSASELKNVLKQLSSKFTPVRNQVEAIESEIARLEELVSERKAKRARLGKKLDELAEQATSSKQALLCVEQNMKKSKIKKDEADKTVSKFHIIWESLKVSCYIYHSSKKLIKYSKLITNFPFNVLYWINNLS